MFYAVGESAPSETELRQELDIPAVVPFLGWAVHTPLEDGFLLTDSVVSDSSIRSFGPRPEQARLYTIATEAAVVVDSLKYPANLVALFDTDNHVISIPVGGNRFSDFADR